MAKSQRLSNLPNAPAFSAYAGSAQTLGTATEHKVQINTEEFDTASAFDSSTNYRFTPQVAGYYQVNGCVTHAGVTATYFYCMVYKNGSVFKYGSLIQATSSAYGSSNVSALIYLNGSTDYIELYAISQVGVNTISGAGRTYFQATLVRPA